MATYVRRRNTAIAVKLETISGTNAFTGAPDPLVDFMKGDIDIAYQQDQINIPEVSGSLDGNPPIAGGTRVSVTITAVMRGSGAAATPPRWAKLLKVCTWKEIITAATVGAPTAAAAGTATTATLAAPFAATSEVYRGAPIVLSGNPATPFTTFVTDYTAGRVATFGHSFSPVLDTTTLAQIPVHVRYEPTSDNTLFFTATIVAYQDGLVFTTTGCAGTFDITLPDAGPGSIRFTLTGQFNPGTAGAVPTGITYDPENQPPLWRNGQSRIDRAIARTNQLTLAGGVTSIYPENPEAPEGFDASTVTGRNITGALAPLMSVTDTQARMASFKAGTPQSIIAGWGEAAGNSFGIVVPSSRYTGYSYVERNGLMAENIAFAATGQDSGAYIVCR